MRNRLENSEQGLGRARWRALAVAIFSFSVAGCLEPPPHLKTPSAVAKMTREEKTAVVEKALAEAKAIELADPEATQPEEIDWKTELAEMKGVLRPSQEQADALDRAFSEQQFEIELWMKSEKYARLLALEAALREPAEPKEHERLKAEAKPLRAELKQITRKHRTQVLASLSEESRLKWMAHRLTERMRELMLPLKLTDEQIAELRSRAWHAIERSADTPKPADIEAEAFKQLERQMEKEVLGPGQQRTYETVKKDYPNRSL